MKCNHSRLTCFDLSVCIDETAVGTCYFKIRELASLYRLVECQHHIIALHLSRYHLRRQFHLIIIYKAVETKTNTFCHFLFAQGMDIHRLTQVVDDGQFRMLIGLGCQSLCLAQTSPVTVVRRS